jgi:hypothetical protein
MSDATGLTAARWVTSTRSGPTGGNCVQVACLRDGRVAVRNSRHPAGPALLFGPEQWAAFVTAIAGRQAPAGSGNPSSSLLSWASETSGAPRASAAG